MIGALLAVALAGTVVLESPPDPFARCVAEAEAVAGSPEATPLPEGPIEQLAIVVGVPCHRSPDIPSLAYSSRDATRMGSALEEAGFTVVRLTSEVDRKQLERALDDLAAQVPTHGTVLVYFSGHGVLFEDRGRVRRHLVFSDTTLDRVAETAMPAAALERRLGALPVRDAVLVQDTCYAARAEAGGKSVITRQAGSKQLALPDPTAAVRAGEQRLYASQFYEQALELPEIEGSVYTHHWLASLDDPAADLDGDGCVGTLEAHWHATAATEADRGGFQHPQLVVREPRNLALGCAGSPSQAVILTDDGARAVEPGAHEIGAGRVHLRAGEWVDAAAILSERRGYGWVGPTVGAADLGTGASPAFGGEAWVVTPERGLGRPAFGLTGQLLPALGQPGDGPGFSGGFGLARAGWWADRGGLAIGPVLDLGLAWRTPTQDGLSGDPSLATVVGTSLHAHLARGPVVVALDLGARGFARSRASGTMLYIGPTTGITVGLRR